MHKKNKSHRAILFYSLFCFAVFAVDFAWGETGAAVQPDTKAELKKSVENAILNKVIENVDDAATDVKKKIINDAEKLEVQSQQQGKPVDPESLDKATHEALQTVDEVVGDLKEQQEIHGTDEKESVLAPVETVPATKASPIKDVGIGLAVKNQLLLDPEVEGMKVNVDTKDGVVSLKGQLPTEHEKQRAAAIAANVSGVELVKNNLVVNPEPAPIPVTGVLMKVIGAVVGGIIFFVLLLWWLKSSEDRSLKIKTETRSDSDQTQV